MPRLTLTPQQSVVFRTLIDRESRGPNFAEKIETLVLATDAELRDIVQPRLDQLRSEILAVRNAADAQCAAEKARLDTEISVIDSFAGVL